MRTYVIRYENGEVRYGEFNNYDNALNYAESRSGGWEFSIEEMEENS